MKPSKHALFEFEQKLSAFIAESGLSTYDAITAIGVSMARVFYGLEALHGRERALNACQLLDEVMVTAWDDFSETENKGRQCIH